MLYFATTMARAASSSFWALLATFSLYTLFDLIEHTRIVLAYRAPLVVLADLAVAHGPTALYQLLPLSVLLGCLSVMMQMSRDRELLALASAGQGLFRRLLPFLAVGLVAMAFMLVWGEKTVPPAERHYRWLVDISIKHKDRWGSKWRPQRLWFVGPSGMWRVGSGGGAELTDVTLYRLGENGNLVHKLSAERMSFENESWTGFGLVYRDPEGRVLARHERRVVKVPEGPSHFQVIWEAAEEMTLAELRRAIAVRRSQGMESLGYETTLFFRGSLPMLCLSLPLIGASLMWRRGLVGRSKGSRLVMLGLGVGLGLVFFFLIVAGKTAAQAGFCPPWAGAWLPSLLALVVGLLGVRHVRI